MQDIWTIQKILQWTTGYFQKNRVPDSRLSAELLLAHVLRTSRVELYLQFERILTRAELDSYRNYIQRRAQNEPVQYITGEQDFMGLTLKVTPTVLIPRPETELLVEMVLEDSRTNYPQGCSILDIGTGSGAIAISLAHYRPDCRITAMDKSREALAVARENARRFQLHNIEFREENIFRIQLSPTSTFHYVVSNPPYISEEDYRHLHPQVRNYEPREALLAGKSGLEFHQKLVPVLPGLLQEKGSVFMEIGYDQRDPVEALFLKHRFREITFIRDYQHIYRIIKANL